MTRSRVLVSGGSGLIGSSLIRALDAKSICIEQLTRQTRTLAIPETGREVLWNPMSANPLADPGVLDGVEAVVHLSGANVAAHRWTDAYKGEIVSSRVRTTGALVSILTQLKQKPHVFLCASAVGIYGDRGESILDEESPAGSGFLAETCRRWEDAANAAEDAGIRVISLRFGVVLTRKGGALAKMLPLFRWGLGGKLGSGRQWMSWVTLRDAVRIILHGIDDETLRGPINVTAPVPITNTEFTHALGRAVHRPAIAAAPAFALKLAVGQMAEEALLASVRAVPAKLAASGFRFQDGQIDGALRAVLSGSEAE